jgi:hypothetical protein
MRTLVKVVFHEKSNLTGPVLTRILANPYFLLRETDRFSIEIHFGAFSPCKIHVAIQ